MFFMKSHFDMVFTSQIRVFHGRPISLILCIIDVSLFVQYIGMPVFYMHIYIYIHICIHMLHTEKYMTYIDNRESRLHMKNTDLTGNYHVQLTFS